MTRKGQAKEGQEGRKNWWPTHSANAPGPACQPAYRSSYLLECVEYTPVNTWFVGHERYLQAEWEGGGSAVSLGCKRRVRGRGAAGCTYNAPSLPFS